LRTPLEWRVAAGGHEQKKRAAMMVRNPISLRLAVEQAIQLRLTGKQLIAAVRQNNNYVVTESVSKNAILAEEALQRGKWQRKGKHQD